MPIAGPAGECRIRTERRWSERAPVSKHHHCYAAGATGIILTTCGASPASTYAGNRRLRRQRSSIAEHGQATAIAISYIDQVRIPSRIRLARMAALLTWHVDAEVG